MSENIEFKVNGKGSLSWTNIMSVCKHGKTDDLNALRDTIITSRESTQSAINDIEHGLKILKIDSKKVLQDYKGLVAVKATKKELKKAIKKFEVVKELNDKYNYLSYLDKAEEKVSDAMG